jgi:hypothetical protein
VQFSDEYAREHDLPRSARFPWDDSKGVYFIKALHEIHCLVSVQSYRVAYLSLLQRKTSGNSAKNCTITERQLCHGSTSNIASTRSAKTSYAGQTIPRCIPKLGTSQELIKRSCVETGTSSSSGLKRRSVMPATLSTATFDLSYTRWNNTLSVHQSLRTMKYRTRTSRSGVTRIRSQSRSSIEGRKSVFSFTLLRNSSVHLPACAFSYLIGPRNIHQYISESESAGK